MNLPSLYEAVQAAYEEERLAKQTLRSVQDLKRYHYIRWRSQAVSYTHLRAHETG